MRNFFRRFWNRKAIAAGILLWLACTCRGLGQERPAGRAVYAPPVMQVGAGESSPPPTAVAEPRGSLEEPPLVALYSEGTPLPRRAQSATTTDAPSTASRGRGVATVLGSLAIVLGLFFLVAWGFRRTMPAAQRWLPSGAIEVLGRAPLANRQTMHLIRVGGRLLLVNVTPQGAQTLTEIKDPGEVEQLLAVCETSQQNSVSESFRKVLADFERDKVRGFIDDPATSTEPTRTLHA